MAKSDDNIFEYQVDNPVLIDDDTGQTINCFSMSIDKANPKHLLYNLQMKIVHFYDGQRKQLTFLQTHFIINYILMDKSRYFSCNIPMGFEAHRDRSL
jgi:hypothetical protein